MKKQFIQFGVVVVVLLLCIGGYFGITKYYEQKTEKEKDDKIIVLEIADYKKMKSVTYDYSGKTIQLSQTDGKWTYVGDSSVRLDGSNIESNMLSRLASVEAVQKIEAPKDISEYGFHQNEDGVMEPSTNTIIVVDSKDNTYTIYIGDANPYDSTQYYMMIDGDDNVYVTDSSLADSFYKSIEDITEEETTTEEATTEEAATEEADTAEDTAEDAAEE